MVHMDGEAALGCESVTLAHDSPGGEAELQGRYVAPADADASAACVLLVHGVYGMQPGIDAALGRLARAGYHALSVDLYRAAGLAPAADADDEARAWGELADREALKALESAAAWLGKRGDRRSLAVMGFGLGGSLAFLMGCTSRRVAALVSCYGTTLYPELSSTKPAQPLELFLNLDRPYLGLFAEHDRNLPADHQQLLSERLEAGHKEHELLHFPGTRQGFMEPDHANFDEANACAAWERTLGFLQDTL